MTPRMPDNHHPQSADKPDEPSVALTAASAQAEIQLETAISRWLAGGMLASGLLILAGWFVSLLQHPAGEALSQKLALAQLPAGLAHVQGPAIILLGLTVLTLTPVIRVLITFVHYIRTREWPFILITGFVLAAMIVGLFVGATG